MVIQFLASMVYNRNGRTNRRNGVSSNVRERSWLSTPTNVNNDVELSTNDSNAVNGCLISLCH